MASKTRQQAIKIFAIVSVVLIHLGVFMLVRNVVVFRNPPPSPPDFYGFVPPPRALPLP